MPKSAAVTKVLVPVAGLGTRFLPISKAIPKEMLPLVDVPVIEYVIEDAVKAGLTDVLLITGRNKSAIENYFDKAAELENHLTAHGDTDKLRKLEQLSSQAHIHYVRQGEPRGLGHAISTAEYFVSGEPFAVLLGDDLLLEGDELLRVMCETSIRHQAIVIALQEVAEEHVSQYGIVEAEELSPGSPIVRITGLVEKPTPENAPSRLAVIGRYILGPAIFDALSETASDSSGEVQLTDALNAIAEGKFGDIPVLGVKYTGTRFDTGNKLTYSQAFIEFALRHPEIGGELKHWLSTTFAQAPSSEVEGNHV